MTSAHRWNAHVSLACQASQACSAACSLRCNLQPAVARAAAATAITSGAALPVERSAQDDGFSGGGDGGDSLLLQQQLAHKQTLCGDSFAGLKSLFLSSCPLSLFLVLATTRCLAVHSPAAQSPRSTCAVSLSKRVCFASPVYISGRCFLLLARLSSRAASLSLRVLSTSLSFSLA